MRVIAIWITGLVSFAIFGGVFTQSSVDQGGVFGIVGGPLLFICLRLWFTEPPQKDQDNYREPY